jgi:hypothetical protein
MPLEACLRASAFRYGPQPRLAQILRLDRSQAAGSGEQRDVCRVRQPRRRILLNFDLGAEMLNFGVLLAFMGVNAAALKHHYVRAGEKKLTARTVFRCLSVTLAESRPDGPDSREHLYGSRHRLRCLEDSRFPGRTRSIRPAPRGLDRYNRPDENFVLVSAAARCGVAFRLPSRLRR